RLRTAYEAAVARALQPLHEAYERELRKLQDSHTRSGNLDAALAAKQELEKLTTKSAGARPSSTPARDSEAFFVGKSWQNPTGTVFTFNQDGECTREHSGTRTVGRWRRRGSIVEATEKVPQDARYFRFVSATEAYVGNSPDDVKTPLSLK
ncbi:MAG: hypothetical protein U0984_05420, partial [Prosthecobacter sp.]|nr:hypothetical protein [Prosthecobacter sp.]